MDLIDRWNAASPEERAAMKPSGKKCIEPGCGKPAGTPWGPYWCPDCDDIRRNRITESLESFVDDLKRAEVKP